MCNMDSAPRGNNPTKRSASKACSACHARKVRCDLVISGTPCTNCRKDAFECTAHSRKKRQKKSERLVSRPQPSVGGPARDRPIPEHQMLHKFPFYPLYRNINTPRGNTWLYPKNQDRGVLLPISVKDPSATAGGQLPAHCPDVEFLRAKGALDLPPRDSMDTLVACYFRLFHPFFPIVDRKEFLAVYNESDQDATLAGRGPSLLLLQAINFTASSYVDSATIRALGFASRKECRSALHDRIRHLYNFNYEQDDITNIQALLLMSHYFPSMVEQKHTWLWAHQAISLAQGAGLHHDSMQGSQNKVEKRIWWACLLRDRLIALGTGRPMHINSLDCSVPPPTLSDLIEDNDKEEDIAVKSIFVQFVCLCQYIEGVLSLAITAKEDLSRQKAVCETALAQWHDRLGPDATPLEHTGESSAHGRGGAAVLYRIILRLVHNTVLLALRQAGSAVEGNPGCSSKTPSREVQEIALDSTKLMVSIMDQGMAYACPTICVTVTLPASVIHLQSLFSEEQNVDKAASRAGIQHCLHFLKELGDIYWHAGFYHDFFQDMLDHADRSKPGTQGQAATSRQVSRRRTRNLRERHVAELSLFPQQASAGNIGQTAPAYSLDTLISDAALPDSEESLTTFSPNFTQQPGSTDGQTMNLDDGLFTYDREYFLGGDWFDDFTSFQAIFPSA